MSNNEQKSCEGQRGQFNDETSETRPDGSAQHSVTSLGYAKLGPWPKCIIGCIMTSLSLRSLCNVPQTIKFFVVYHPKIHTHNTAIVTIASGSARRGALLHIFSYFFILSVLLVYLSLGEYEHFSLFFILPDKFFSRTAAT